MPFGVSCLIARSHLQEPKLRNVKKSKSSSGGRTWYSEESKDLRFFWIGSLTGEWQFKFYNGFLYADGLRYTCVKVSELRMVLFTAVVNALFIFSFISFCLKHE